MTAPIRDMAGLIEAMKKRRDVLNLSHETIDIISGVPSGYTSKLFAHKPMKNLGYLSMGLLLGALGMALQPVDDAEQSALVEGRWSTRKRPQKRDASPVSAKQEETTVKYGQVEGFALMQILGRAGGMASGKKRRAKAMRRRELQRKRSHAARMRWSKKGS